MEKEILSLANISDTNEFSFSCEGKDKEHVKEIKEGNTEEIRKGGVGDMAFRKELSRMALSPQLQLQSAPQSTGEKCAKTPQASFRTF